MEIQEKTETTYTYNIIGLTKEQMEALRIIVGGIGGSGPLMDTVESLRDALVANGFHLPINSDNYFTRYMSVNKPLLKSASALGLQL